MIRENDFHQVSDKVTLLLALLSLFWSIVCLPALCVINSVLSSINPSLILANFYCLVMILPLPFPALVGTYLCSIEHCLFTLTEFASHQPPHSLLLFIHLVIFLLL
jgi:hypothetical protein